MKTSHQHRAAQTRYCQQQPAFPMDVADRAVTGCQCLSPRRTTSQAARTRSMHQDRDAAPKAGAVDVVDTFREGSEGKSRSCVRNGVMLSPPSGKRQPPGADHRANQPRSPPVGWTCCWEAAQGRNKNGVTSPHALTFLWGHAFLRHRIIPILEFVVEIAPRAYLPPSQTRRPDARNRIRVNPMTMRK